MRKLRIFEHISLDGVIQVSGIPSDGDFPYGDWTAPYRTPEGFAKVTAMYGETYDLLLGRRTYDGFSAFWPKAPKSPMAERLNAATKYVVTHRPESLEWGPFEAVGPGRGSEIAESIRSIKAKGGKDLILTGSSTVTSALIEHGLVDEMVLMVNPVLLGKGKRLFAEGTPPRAFALESTHATPSGIVVNIYKAAGHLQNLK
jgi:dihydrofolate reductase